MALGAVILPPAAHPSYQRPLRREIFDDGRTQIPTGSGSHDDLIFDVKKFLHNIQLFNRHRFDYLCINFFKSLFIQLDHLAVVSHKAVNLSLDISGLSVHSATHALLDQ